MKRNITSQWSHVYIHDDEANESVIRRSLSGFFRTPHGKRETYTFYKGFIIVRNTVQFTRQKPQRRTQIYMYLPVDDPDGPDVSYCGEPHNVREAKQWIDRILASGNKDINKSLEDSYSKLAALIDRN